MRYVPWTVVGFHGNHTNSLKTNGFSLEYYYAPRKQIADDSTLEIYNPRYLRGRHETS